jgi:hypothetical protein
MENIQDILAFDPGGQHEDVGEILKFDPGSKQEKTQVAQQPVVDQDDELTWREAVVEGLGNIPSSAWNYAKDMATPMLHPKETAQSLWGLTKGFVQKAVPGRQDEEKYVDAMVDFYKKRYGSVDGFKQTIADDPVGLLADVASVISGAGLAAKGVGAVSKVGKLAKTAKNIEKLGVSLEPLNVAKRIAASPLRLIPEGIPVKMYESAVKFGTTMTTKQRKAITRTALAARNQIMPTSKGVEKLRGLIDDYNVQINDLIGKSADSGRKIPVQGLYKGLNDIKEQFKRMSDEPKKWDKAFRDVIQEGVEAFKVDRVRTPQEVQKIKTGIYKNLKSLYEQHKSAPAKKELRKAVARNAKELLEEIIPEIKGLNRREGELLELLDAIESKANRITNRDLIGIGLPVKMGTGSGIGYMVGGPQGGAAGTALGFLLGVYDTPQVKSKMALVLSRLKEKGITVKPTESLVRLGLYQMAKPEDFQEEK